MFKGDIEFFDINNNKYSNPVSRKEFRIKYRSMNKSQAVYVGSGANSIKLPIHSYAQSCELYQIFAEISRIVARKSNSNVSQALVDYLSQCNKGDHVVLKSYASFSKSIVNRQCFLYNFCKIFQTETNLRNGLDYCQLFRLLCSDFPKEIIVNAVRILEGRHDKMMEVLLNSQKFLHALYIQFIYAEYLDSMLQKVFKGSEQQEVLTADVFEWMKSSYDKDMNWLSKPEPDVLYQILLNHLGSKGGQKGKDITFLNENTIGQYVSTNAGEGKNSSFISYEKLLSYLLANKKHEQLALKYIFLFENSGNWANEASKLVSVRELENPTPLNSKKIKKK